jgi:Delta7-sterol 5-desaturase
MGKEWYFLSPRFWSAPDLILIFSVSIFAVVWVRYLVLAWLYRSVLRRLRLRQINGKLPPGQWRSELMWSTLSSAVFSVLTLLTFLAYENGMTRIYTGFYEHSVSYFLLSVVVMLVLYETYYYWLHRWMHRPSVFRIVHKVHHESLHTSVFTSFSFHPLEAFLQFLFLPLIICVMPVHPYAIGLVLMLMTLSAIINHAGVEVFPPGFRSNTLGRWLIGATHHDLHHKEFRTNFGLYFTFWDKWMKTESKNYDNAFRKNTGSGN